MNENNRILLLETVLQNLGKVTILENGFRWVAIEDRRNGGIVLSLTCPDQMAKSNWADWKVKVSRYGIALEGSTAVLATVEDTMTVLGVIREAHSLYVDLATHYSERGRVRFDDSASLDRSLPSVRNRR